MTRSATARLRKLWNKHKEDSVSHLYECLCCKRKLLWLPVQRRRAPRNMSQCLSPQLPILRAHRHKDVSLRLRKVPNGPFNPLVGQTTDDFLGLSIWHWARRESPVQRTSEAFGKVFRRDEFCQCFRSFRCGENEDFFGGCGVEPSSDETPDRREEIGSSNDEDFFHGFGIVCCSHATCGLKKGAEVPEFAKPHVRKIYDVYGFVDDYSVIVHPFAKRLREICYVFCR